MIKATLRNPALRKRASQFGRLVRHSAVTPLSGETHKPRLVSNGELGVTFIGHSSFFVQMGGQSVMLDPNFARWLFVLKRLRRPGLRVRDLPAIDLVLVTHAHFDHMGSIAEFPNAHIYIQKSELLSWYEAFALPPRFAHLTTIVDPDNIRSALDASIAHRVTLVDGDKNDVLPGIHVRLGSGHTIGHQFVVIETGAGRRVISGDCVYSRRQFTGHNNDGVYVPLNNAVGSVWEQLKTIDKMNDELGGDLARLVVLHDTERWKGHTVVGEVEGFRIVKIG